MPNAEVKKEGFPTSKRGEGEVEVFVNATPLSQSVSEGIVDPGGVVLTTENTITRIEGKLNRIKSWQRVRAIYNYEHNTNYSIGKILSVEYNKKEQSIGEVAKNLGVSYPITHKWLRRLGYTTDRQGNSSTSHISPTISPLDLYRLYEVDRRTRQGTALELGVSLDTVTNDLTAYGFPIFSHSEAMQNSWRHSRDKRSDAQRGYYKRRREFLQTEEGREQEKEKERDVLFRVIGEDPVGIVTTLYREGLRTQEIAGMHRLSVERLRRGLLAFGTSPRAILHNILREQSEGQLSEIEEERVDTLPNLDLSDISERRREQLQRRYLPRGRRPTLRELADERGVTQERIRQELATDYSKAANPKKKEEEKKEKSGTKKKKNSRYFEASQIVKEMNKAARKHEE